MIKTLIFSQYFVRVLFVLAGVFFITAVFAVKISGETSPEFAAFFGLALTSLISGKKIQFAR